MKCVIKFFWPSTLTTICQKKKKNDMGHSGREEDMVTIDGFGQNFYQWTKEQIIFVYLLL